ncbi:contact-dependent growth inhibition system immunity protein [Serratia microhaemolytica]|uniref:contact-dependent growth inhibition system immunity protein n=1 Tax=Serratia microhaemolytica TaxID=2675110 RepID=UPI000FDED4B6|nr:contact-dependent growth inhibition system immunity protein [Serratia microhaemolytica]
MMLHFSELEQLLGAYFHQDWDLDHPDADGVIKFYKQDVDSKTIFSLKQQVLHLIDSDNTDDDLQSLLFEKMGCCYYYPSEWGSSKEWLKHIIDVLDEE